MIRLKTTFTVCLLLGFSPHAFAQDATDEWQWALTPYLWLPTIDGSLAYEVPPSSGGGTPNVSVGPTDWLDLLNYGALISGTARKGAFSIQSDFVYLSMTSNNDGRLDSVVDRITTPGVPAIIPVDVNLIANTRTDLDGLTWTITAGYDISPSERTRMDVFLGARYFGADVSTSWNLTAEITTPGGTTLLPAQGAIGDDADIWDGVIGVRGEVAFSNERWSMPYYLDAGTGSSDLTWNAIIGLAREFSWGDVVFAYRHLAWDQASDKLLQDFSFGGPAIGFRFQF